MGNETRKTGAPSLHTAGGAYPNGVDRQGNFADFRNGHRFTEPYGPNFDPSEGSGTLSSGVERSLHTRQVSGSIPLASTTQNRTLIGVCTYKRPLMLAKCLDSLAAQVGTDRLHLHIVVVDNEAGAPRQSFVQDFAEHCRFPVHYRHEPKRGIAAARNAVLDTAVTLGSDWVAFIDDDEEAAPDWISQLMAPEYLSVPVLAGRNRFTPLDPAPFWYVGKPSKAGAEGAHLKAATTGNIRFSADLIKAGLRFDETLGLMGGEDQLFFQAGRNLGFEMRRTERALTYEDIHVERVTYAGQVHRAYWCAASDVQRLALEKGWWSAVGRKAHTIPLSFIFGALELVASPLFLVAGVRRFKKRALAGGKKMAKGAGRLAAIVGHLPQPYRVTVGS